MLNNINNPITRLFAEIQNAVADNAACETLEQECAFMVAGGKERIYLNTLASTLTGNIINRITANVVPEETIRVYAAGVKKKLEQSLNASLYMVACHSLLLSGYTNRDIIETALINWADEDNIMTSFKIDYSQVANDIVAQMQRDGILETEVEQAQTPDGAFFNAHGLVEGLIELRLATMIKLWDNAKPKMKPMLHKLTWQLNGTCELKNLTFKEEVTQDFIDSLNRMGHTPFKINRAIKAQVKRNLNRGVYPLEQEQSFDELIRLDPDKVYYLPHTPDYRGRVYARGGLTTPSGVKDMRAAFDFAELTKVDEYGLFLHIANAYGYDKASITDRLQWVKDNHISLMTTPQKNLYAERARLAYIEYKETGYSNVICRIDGTVSGVQMTSGIFLDAKTGAAVNVGKSSPDDKPQDLYGLVAETALKLAKRGTDKALIAKYMRDLTKQPIMILAYGAGEKKLIDSIHDFLAAKGERTTNSKSVYKIIMAAIESAFPAITRLNKQLQREIEYNPLSKLSYQLSDIKVKFKPTNTEHLNLYGTSYTAKLVGKRLPDADALARGIAPNFVHSLDSELLRKAVNIIDTDVSCIHDDIGVQSGQVRKALQAVRTSYVEVIQSEPLKALYTGMKIPEEYFPDDNGLVLNDVLESAYLFS